MAKRRVASTRLSILGWVLLPLVMAMSIGFTATSFVLLGNTAEEIDNQLIQEAEELQILSDRAVNPSTGEKYSSAEEILSLYVSRTVADSDETVFVVVDGVVTERSSGEVLGRLDRDLQFVAEINTNDQPVLATYESELGPVRYISIPVTGESDNGQMVAAIFIDVRNEPVRLLLFQLAALLLLAILGSAGLGWIVAGRILKPIRDLRETVGKISEGSLEERIPVANPDSELGGIAREFNQMLEKIQKSFDTQKRFVDDAGHELKTPLTIVSGHIDLVETANEDSKASLSIVRDEVKRMSRIVQDLQTLTKSNEPRFIQMTTNSISETIDEVFVKATGLEERNWKLSAADDQEIFFDRQRIVQAMLQLVDNSLKHTTESDSIEIGFRNQGKLVEFFVGDSGPGIPENSRNQIVERFKRGEWTSQDTEGSGLGLAIVDAVCKAHNGSLVIRESNLGGAEVILQIPTNLNQQEVEK